MNKLVYVPVNKTHAPPEARRFVEDVIKLCRKHGFGLSYEGTPFSGNFVIEPFHSSFAGRLWEASVFIPGDEHDG